MNEIQRRRLEEIRAHEHRIEILRKAGLKPEDTEPIVKLVMDKIQAIKDEESKEIEETQKQAEIAMEAPPEPPKAEPLDIRVNEPQEAPQKAPEAPPAPSFTQRPGIESVAPAMPQTLVQSYGPGPVEFAQTSSATSPEPMKLEAAPPQTDPVNTPAVADAATSLPGPPREPSPQPELQVPKAPEVASIEPYVAPVPNASPVVNEPVVELAAQGGGQPNIEAIDAGIVDIFAEPTPAAAVPTITPEPLRDTNVAETVKPPQQDQQELPPPPKGGIKAAAESRAAPVSTRPPQAPPSPGQMFEEAQGQINALTKAAGFDTLEDWKQFNLAGAQTDDTRFAYGSTAPASMPGANPRSVHQAQSNLATAADTAAMQAGELAILMATAIVRLSRDLATAKAIIEEGSL